MSSRLDGNLAVTILEAVWEVVTRVAAFVRAENKSLSSLVAKIIISILAYGAVYVELAGSLLTAVEYLLMHRWYLLAATCCLVLLLLSAGMLALYEHLWHWQGNDCIRAFFMRGRDHSNRSSRNAVVEDDDHEWMEMGKTVLRWLGKFLLWCVFVLLNTELHFWIFSQYLVAHPHYSTEVVLVDSMEVLPLLVGSAVALLHLYPQFFDWQGGMEEYSSSTRYLPVNQNAQQQVFQNNIL